MVQTLDQAERHKHTDGWWAVSWYLIAQLWLEGVVIYGYIWFYFLAKK